MSTLNNTNNDYYRDTITRWIIHSLNSLSFIRQYWTRKAGDSFFSRRGGCKNMLILTLITSPIIIFDALDLAFSQSTIRALNDNVLFTFLFFFINLRSTNSCAFSCSFVSLHLWLHL